MKEFVCKFTLPIKFTWYGKAEDEATMRKQLQKVHEELGDDLDTLSCGDFQPAVVESIKEE